MGTWSLEYRQIGYTSSLDDLVRALCRDFERRRDAIREGSVGKRTYMEYAYINGKMLDAACELAGEREAEIYIREIGEKIGYAYSEIPCASEVLYKKRKLEIKLNIARKLHLLD